MRIGLVRRGFSPTGGAEAYLSRLANALESAGHTCLLFTSEKWPEAFWPNREAHLLAGHSPKIFAQALEAQRRSYVCDYLFSLERVLHCDCFRAGDGVHAAWLKRRSATEPFWKSWSRSLFNYKHSELLSLERQLFSGSDSSKTGSSNPQPLHFGASSVIANCQMVKDEIIQTYGYPPERIHVVYNGIPPRTLPVELRLASRVKLGLSENDFVVLFAGSGWDRKGLCHAIAGINQVRLPAPLKPLLLVAGRGNPRRFAPSERVRFLGPTKEMDNLYAAANAFILPTLYDPFSNACLEALSAGLPVITTTANGFSEIIQPGIEGEVLAHPEDSAAVASAIQAWSDPERRSAIRPRLLELGAKFSMEANVAATLKVITGSEDSSST